MSTARRVTRRTKAEQERRDARALRKLRGELRNALALVARGPQDERARGQGEALRHVQTVIQVQTGRRR
jgi:hypothetical protein